MTQAETKRAGRLPASARKSAPKKEIRERSEDPIYLDLDVLQEKEDKRYWEFEAVMTVRHEAAALAKEAEAKRKEADVALMEIIDKYSLDGLIVGDMGVDRIYNKGPQKTDKPYILRILTPEQTEKAFKPGTPYAYIKAIEKVERVEEIRDGL